jgi:hypothetical protein
MAKRSSGQIPTFRTVRHRAAEGRGGGEAAKIEVLRAELDAVVITCRRLCISPRTMNTHLRHVFAKLGVPNRVALAVVVHHSIKCGLGRQRNRPQAVS